MEMDSAWRMDITVKGLETLCRRYHDEELDEVTFQKKAAEFVVRWAACEKAIKDKVPMGDFDPDVLVDVVARPQVEWKPSVEITLKNTRTKWAIVVRSFGKTKNLFDQDVGHDIEFVIGTFQSEKEARDWLESMDEEFKRRKHPEGRYTTKVTLCHSAEQIEHAYD